MDVGHCSSSGKISLLPNTVIENILMCLPLQEAVRTSVLSRSWRYIWTKLPQLVFDDSFCNGSIRKDKSKLMMNVYRVLLLHCGPILKFTLSLYGLESCSDIDHLLLFLLKNGVKDLKLGIWKGEYYKLPSALFSCVQLEHLNLRGCVFRPPPRFKGFSVLVSLEFHEVVITGDVCSSLISSCPQLERVTLDRLTHCNHLDIVAPSLRFFHYEGFLSSICFKSTPHLETLSMYLNEDGYHVIEDGEEEILMPLNSLPAVTYLTLDWGFLKYMIVGGVPKRIANMIHLKTLKLYDISLGETDEALSFLCLIRSSPALEKITISAYTDSLATEPALEVLENEDFLDVSFNQLREVEMENVCGMKSELIFIKVLLAKSPMLERILISPGLLEVNNNGLRFLKEVTRFRRASPLAEITYISP